MIAAKVIGTVVCTQKDKSLLGRKILIVQPLDLETMEASGKPITALDAVGSGPGEIVLVVSGSSARMTEGFQSTCVDQSIVGILDSVEVNGGTVYEKNPSPAAMSNG